MLFLSIKKRAWSRFSKWEGTGGEIGSPIPVFFSPRKKNNPGRSGEAEGKEMDWQGKGAKEISPRDSGYSTRPREKRTRKKYFLLDEKNHHKRLRAPETIWIELARARDRTRDGAVQSGPKAGRSGIRDTSLAFLPGLKGGIRFLFFCGSSNDIS